MTRCTTIPRMTATLALTMGLVFSIAAISQAQPPASKPFQIVLGAEKGETCKKKASCKKHGLRITVKPGVGYKINKDYPWKVLVSADSSLSIPEKTLKKSDAVSLKETEAVFDVCYLAATGGKPAGAMKITVKFSICDQKQCLMFTEEVPFVVK